MGTVYNIGNNRKFYIILERGGWFVQLRQVQEQDYLKLSDVVNEWGGATNVFQTVPRFLFAHFQQSSFIIETKQETVGILVGLISQTNPKQAYIHFVAVNPDFRRQGIARKLYQHFFEVVKEYGVQEVFSMTAPINRVSIAFHESLGFSHSRIENYNGPGEHRIEFYRELSKQLLSIE